MRSILIAVAATVVLAAGGQAQERPAAAGRAVPAGMAEQVGAGSRVAARGPKGGTRVQASAARASRRTPAQRVKRAASN